MSEPQNPPAVELSETQLADAQGGIPVLLLPAIQKIREPASSGATAGGSGAPVLGS